MTKQARHARLRRIGSVAAVLLSGLICWEAGGTAEAAAPKPIAVTLADAPTLKKAIAAQTGHVVIVNFWATWCVPCVQEFPAFVRLQHRYRNAGVVVFAVSADLKKDIRSKVQPFLTKRHADFPQFLQQSRDPEDFINAFDPQWQGNLPRTFVYNKQGRLVKILGEELTYKKLITAIKPLLH